MFSLISERKLGDRRRLYLVVHSTHLVGGVVVSSGHITKLLGLPRATEGEPTAKLFGVQSTD